MYAYEKLLQEEKLTIDELPEDARIGIEAIKNIEKAISMSEKMGKVVSDKVKAKVLANDKWVTREILDYLEGKNTDRGALPNKPNEVIEEIKIEQIDPKGVAIEEEITELLKSGETKFALESLKSKAPKAYDVIWLNYEEGEENGVRTSLYTIKESEKEVFTISKN